MNNYPPQLPPPPSGGYNPGGYNPFNPYQGYDPGADYIPWLPGRQSPRFLPLLIIAAAILLCSCCSFLAGTIFGIELPGLVAPSSAASPNDNPDQTTPEDTPTPESFHWRVIYPQT